MKDPREDSDGPRLSPMDELELMDFQVEQAAEDEEKTMFDDDTHPKAFRGLKDKTEPVADDKGNLTDLMADTEDVEVEIGDTDDSVVDGLPEEF